MKIVVCIKQVPDTKGGVQFNPDGTLNRAAMLAIMNPDDKAGLEAALRLKDQYGAEVTVLTMGLPKAADVLREALAMGADKAILVTDRVLGGADTWATSSTIAAALRKLDYDLIITGHPGNLLCTGYQSRRRQRDRTASVRRQISCTESKNALPYHCTFRIK